MTSLIIIDTAVYAQIAWHYVQIDGIRQSVRSVCGVMVPVAAKVPVLLPDAYRPPL